MALSFPQRVWPAAGFNVAGSSHVSHVDSAKCQWYRRANLRGSPQKTDGNVVNERNLYTSLNSQVLVLNRLWQAVNICSARRAFALVYAGHAHVVSSDEANNFMTHDFESWRDFSTTAPEHEMVTTISWKIRVPRVIVLLFFDRLPKKEVKFTRHNVFERDKNTCQYCGQVFERNDLNLDHVVPRERGGTTTWENVVCSCIPSYPQTEAAQVAPICSGHVFGAAARKLAAFRRSRVLECRIERLSVAHSALNR